MIGTCPLAGLRPRFCRRPRGRMLGGGGFGGVPQPSGCRQWRMLQSRRQCADVDAERFADSAAVGSTALRPRQRRAYSAIRDIA